MLTTTAKTAAERKREQRERQKQNRFKDVTFTLEQATIESVTSHSKQQGVTQSDYVNKVLKEVVTSHDTDRIAELEAKSLNCFQCVNWTDDKCSKGLTLTGWTCTDFENWQDKLKDLHREIEQQPKATGTDNGKLLYDYGLVLKDKRDCQKLLVQVQNALKNGQQFIALSLLDDNLELITRDVLNEPAPAKRRSKK